MASLSDINERVLADGRCHVSRALRQAAERIQDIQPGDGLRVSLEALEFLLECEWQRYLACRERAV